MEKKSKRVSKGVERLNPTQVKVEHKAIDNSRVSELWDVVCTHCGQTDSIFTRAETEQEGKEKDRCPTCHTRNTGGLWKRVKKFSPGVVAEIMSRTLVFQAIDGRTFHSRVECDLYNSYILGSAIEGYRCPGCSSIHVQNLTRCENCGTKPSEYQKGILERKTNGFDSGSVGSGMHAPY